VTPFTAARALRAVGAAGFTARRAQPLAFGENAVFDCGPLVVKVGREPGLLGRAERETAVGRRLAELGVPAVRPAGDAVLADGLPVTVWHRLPPAVRAAGTGDLAVLLRAVHALEGEALPGLPRRDLLGGVGRWLRLAGAAVPAADAAFLRERAERLAREVEGLVPVLPPGPVHGDALPRNVHVTADGPVLTDLETFSCDLREHDLVVVVLTADRYGLPAGALREFTDGYGWDVRGWPGHAVLRAARETASCAWVAQRAAHDPAAAAEFALRVRSLREGDPAVRWSAF
jgi:hypothetical protein